jgi:hypothetical protein
MSWKAVYDRVRDIIREVEEIKTVYDTVPRKINDTDLPACFIWPRKVTRKRGSGDEVHETRQIEVYLYLEKDTLGASGEKERQSLDTDYETLIFSQFDGRVQLNLGGVSTGLVSMSAMTGNDGLQIIPFPSGDAKDQYFAYIFTLNLERNLRTQAKE